MRAISRLLVLCGAASFLIAPAARGQSGAPNPANTSQKAAAGKPNEALTDKARELYEQGRKDFEKRRWAEARASFLAAWLLNPHWQIAANLGQCEEALGQYAEAAEHLAYYLREAPAESKEKAKVAFEKVRVKVGAVNVRGDRAGADVLLDGRVIGRAPLEQPVFVTPGKHTLQMRVANEVLAEQSVEAAAGGNYDVTLAANVEHANPTHTADVAPSQPKQPPLQQPQPPPSEDSKLPVRKIVIGAGIGTSAVLIGTGIAFVVASTKNAADAASRLEALEQKSGSSPCYPASQNAAECAELFQVRDDRDRSANIAFWSVLAGGLVGTGTLVYALIPSKHATSSAVQVLPAIAAGSAGLMVRGQW